MAHYAGSNRSFGFRFAVRTAHSAAPVRRLRENNLPDAIVTILEQIFLFFAALGENVIWNVGVAARILYKIYLFVFGRQGRLLFWQWKKLRLRILYFFSKTGETAVRPFHAITRFVTAVGSLRKETRGLPFTHQLQRYGSAAFDGIYAGRRVFLTLVNYLLPIGAIAGTVWLFGYINSFSYALNVTYNGESVGYVQSEAIAESAKQLVQGRMVYLSDSERVAIEPDYSVEVIQDDMVMSDSELADKIIMNSSENILQAEGLYIDNIFCGAISNEGEITRILDARLNEFRSDDDAESVSFVNEIKILPGIYLTDNIISVDDMRQQVNGFSTPEEFYTALEGETAAEIAQKNEISFTRLQSLNDGIDEEDQVLDAGTEVLVAPAQPSLPVQITKLETDTAEVEYDTIETETDDYVKGTKKVLVQGQNGENEITSRVSYVNGDEVNREVLSVRVVREPVTKEVAVGTAVPVAVGSGSVGDGNVPAGMFIWPRNDKINSPYGNRSSGFHGGLDIDGNTGDAVKAAASGTVIFSGTQGSFGKLVIIDHGNGVQTYYAHNSELLVSKGSNVSQGDTISKVGSTGRSTGPHLHFEVRVYNNGKYERVNPINHLP